MHGMKTRSNEAWLAALAAPGPEYDSALEDLRGVLTRSLPYALSPYLSPSDPRLPALVEETIQESLLRVLDHKNEFEGRSQFTTWVQKIAVRVALSELRRKRWQNASLDELVDGDEDGPARPGLTIDPADTPEKQVENDDMLGRVRRIIAEELTPKQRQAIVEIAVRGRPIDEVARRMSTNRNALYKLLHDARVRVKTRLTREGLTALEALEMFAHR